MTSPWLTRPVTQHDASTIAQHRFFNPQEDPGDLASYARWVDTRIGAGSYIGSLAEVNGEVIGGAGATLLDWGPTRGGRGPIKARIVNVYTMPSWRGRGVSRCLVEHVLARCQAMGIGDFCPLTPRHPGTCTPAWASSPATSRCFAARSEARGPASGRNDGSAAATNAAQAMLTHFAR
jgi:GNAT superfamily N-acetyltransferase